MVTLMSTSALKIFFTGPADSRLTTFILYIIRCFSLQCHDLWICNWKIICIANIYVDFLIAISIIGNFLKRRVVSEIFLSAFASDSVTASRLADSSRLADLIMVAHEIARDYFDYILISFAVIILHKFFANVIYPTHKFIHLIHIFFI